SHAAEVIWEEMPDGSFKRRVKRKSPGTFGLCAAIKHKFNIDPVPHLLCNGFTKEETEDALIELHYLGVENLLLIRGDSQIQKDYKNRAVNQYAVDLVKQVSDMNQGIYLDELIDAHPSNFCIGVAAYPEKHFSSPNIAFDIEVLKKKQDNGAHYAVCQMFFDNKYYYQYIEKARAAGVTIPILPGIKILTNRNQLYSIPKAFFVSIPEELTSSIFLAKDDKEVYQIGIDWAYKQSIDLLEHGFLHLHYYIMQNTTPFLKLMNQLKTHF
ncbi:MAG: methylenetetrahydrofolate reductase, partial [Bacteroidia bacterium]|nr:methylenetetrahydrofolate reductase [Bacteroidia bacterium]